MGVKQKANAFTALEIVVESRIIALASTIFIVYLTTKLDGNPKGALFSGAENGRRFHEDSG